jgi:hypothetical protein
MQSIESLERRVAEVMAEQGIGEAEARVVVANENGFPTWERLVDWSTPPPSASQYTITRAANFGVLSFPAADLPAATLRADQPSGLNGYRPSFLDPPVPPSYFFRRF